MFGDKLPADTANRLRRLDPVRDRPALGDAQLQQMVMELVDRDRIPLLELTDVPAGRSASTDRRRAWLPVAAAALIVAAAVAAAVIGRSGPGGGATGVAHVHNIPAAYRSVADDADPLSAAMQVDCGGVSVPVAMLAAPGGAETGTSKASAALRAFLANNPWKGEGTVTAKNWLLLSQTSKTLVYGQRTGRIGVGTVVTLTGNGSAFIPTTLGGCGPAGPGGHESGEPVEATVRGSELTLRWENGSNCGTGSARIARVESRVLVQEAAQSVHILLLSKPAPNTGSLPAGQFCAGVGLPSTAHITLKTPLGTRTLVDDSRVPGSAVDVSN